MNRRDFLKGLGAMLACYGGAKLIPTRQRDALIQWGRENDVIRPVYQGWTYPHFYWQGKQVTWYDEYISVDLTAEMYKQWRMSGILPGGFGEMSFHFSPEHTHTVWLRWDETIARPDGGRTMNFRRFR